MERIAPRPPWIPPSIARYYITVSVEDAVLATVRERPELVEEVRRQVPKAWGKLAAHGITTFRHITGRAPTEVERRAIWSGLWAAVTGGPGPMR